MIISLVNKNCVWPGHAARCALAILFCVRLVKSYI